MPSIAYLLPTSELYGGIRVAIEHAEGLAERGWDARLLSPEPAPTWHRLTIPWHRVAFDSPPDLAGTDVAVGTFYPTVPLAQASGADVAVHLCQGFEGVHREYLPVLDRIEAVYRLPLLKILISEHLAPLLEQRFDARCRVIGQAVDHQLFRPPATPREPRLPSPERPLRVGVVGPFAVRSKGIREALEALSRVRARGVPIEVRRASADPQSEDEAGLGVVDEYRHRVPTAEMPAFYAGLDLLLFSSWDEEGFPLPVVEALACGVPVVLTNIGGFRSLPGDCAVRTRWNDPAAMAEAVHAVALDPAARARLSLAGREAVSQLTLTTVLDRLEAALAGEGAPVPPRSAAGLYTQPR